MAEVLTDSLDPKELRGIALVLAAVIRFGQPELAYRIAAALELDLGDFVGVDEADLEELRSALPGEAAAG